VDVVFQALIMGLVQGLTEFLPVSSSGHLILVPFLLGWDDAFITSLPFGVMLHLGTLAALLTYFRADWLRLIPAGLAAVRERTLAGDPDRRLAWLIATATVPALVIGIVFNDLIETGFREVGLVATTLVIGGAILWIAERWGSRSRGVDELGFGGALGIGVAQAAALVPGISRSGISISAGLFAGLDREAAARFSFLMATPITAAAGLYEASRLVRGDVGVTVALGPLAVGMAASLVSGLVAIAVLLRFLRTHRTDVFVAYRLLLALVVVIVWLGLAR
jgi:undecaprenyl-diphosphatase